MAKPPSALILSTSRDRGGLAAARSLCRSGWRVGVGTPDDGGMLAASVAVRRHHRVARPRGCAIDFLSDVRRALEEEHYDIVFGSGDDFMAALAAYQDQLPVAVPHPAHEVVTKALDKAYLGELAQRCGLAVPRTVTFDEADPAAHYAELAELRLPVVVKCREHWRVGETKPLRLEAELHHDIDQAIAQIELIHQQGARAIVQENIEGRLGALIGIFHQGHLQGAVQQETLRTWPTPNGASSRARSVPLDGELLARSTRLLDELGWTGLVELQFITDEAGTAHLIDLNGRFFGSLALTEWVRPGMPAAWACLELCGRLPRLHRRRRWGHYQWLAGDVRRAAVEKRGSLLRDSLGTLGMALGAVHSVISVLDPGPSLHLLRTISRDGPGPQA